jgi:hypothetical protein
LFAHRHASSRTSRRANGLTAAGGRLLAVSGDRQERTGARAGVRGLEVPRPITFARQASNSEHPGHHIVFGQRSGAECRIRRQPPGLNGIGTEIHEPACFATLSHR